MSASLLAPAALLQPRGRTRQRVAGRECTPQRAACRRRVAACRPLSATLCIAVPPPPPRPARTQLAVNGAAAPRSSQLIASGAAAAPLPPPPPPSLTSTIVVSLPAWLALGCTFFLATFAGLCVVVVAQLLPTLREVAQSARSVKVACSGVVDACDEVEKLAVLMAQDIRCVSNKRLCAYVAGCLHAWLRTSPCLSDICICVQVCRGGH